jgi:integrase/recombinase XerD
VRASLPRPTFPSILQDYFCKRLINQLNASPRTIASYRDTFRLLLRYLADRLKRGPTTITLEDLDAPLILDFLDHLERERANSARTRNTRLAAIRSFMQYAGVQEPASLAIVQRVLAIPRKRFARPLVGFLSREEVNAVLDAPDSSTWSGRRDRVMFATFYNVGARVSEVASLRVSDVTLGPSAQLRIHGKGRKERTVPLWKDTALRLKEWLRDCGANPDAPLFPNRHGQPLTRSGVESRLKEAVKTAAVRCGSLSQRRVSPHKLRHTTAMHLLQAGVDLSVIALWLGHESSSTTHLYLEADLSMKQRALRSVQEPASRRLRFRPTDKVLQFLESL